MTDLTGWFQVDANTVFAMAGLLVAVAGLLGGLYAWVYKGYEKRLDTADGRENIRNNELAENKNRGWFNPYGRVLRFALEKLNGFFGEPFSDKAFDRSLLIAFLYPLILAFIIWGFTDTNVSGIEGFFPEGVDWWLRTLAVLGVAVAVFASYKAGVTEGIRSMRWLLLAFAVAFAFAVAVAFAFALALALAFAFVFAFAFAFAGAVAVAFAFAFAVAFAFAFAVAFAFAFAGAGAVAFAFAFAGAVVVAGAGAGAGAGAIIIKYSRVSRLYPSLIVGLLMLTSVLLLPWLFSFADELTIANYSRSTGIAVFLVFLPVINGLFDWLSLAVTRKLLAGSQAATDRPWRRVFLGCLDFVIALAFLVGLVVSLCGFIGFLNWLASINGLPEFYSLATLLKGIEANPWSINYWWIYVMLFSTLLPTFAHMLIVFASLAIGTRRKKTREKIAAALQSYEDSREQDSREQKKDPEALQKAARFLTLQPVAFAFLGGSVIMLLVGWLVYLLPAIPETVFYLATLVTGY